MSTREREVLRKAHEEKRKERLSQAEESGMIEYDGEGNMKM